MVPRTLCRFTEGDVSGTATPGVHCPWPVAVSLRARAPLHAACAGLRNVHSTEGGLLSQTGSLAVSEASAAAPPETSQHAQMLVAVRHARGSSDALGLRDLPGCTLGCSGLAIQHCRQRWWRLSRRPGVARLLCRISWWHPIATRQDSLEHRVRPAHSVLHALYVLLSRAATQRFLPLPPAWGARTRAPCPREWLPLQPCCQKGISPCPWGGLPDLHCVGNGCHASTMAACQRSCSGGLDSAWPAPAARLQTTAAGLTPHPLCLLLAAA